MGNFLGNLFGLKQPQQQQTQQLRGKDILASTNAQDPTAPLLGGTVHRGSAIGKDQLKVSTDADLDKYANLQKEQPKGNKNEGGVL